MLRWEADPVGDCGSKTTSTRRGLLEINQCTSFRMTISIERTLAVDFHTGAAGHGTSIGERRRQVHPRRARAAGGCK